MSGTTGIPGMDTGNATWNQGLGTLASALFPNPASIAQAGYYGAQTRKTNLESLRLQEQFASAHRALMMQPDTGQPQPSPIQFTGNLPGQPPILAEPANLPRPSLGQTVAGAGGGAGGGGAVPAQPVSPQGGPGGPPGAISPENLSTVLAPGTAPFEKGFGATGTPPPASPPSSGAPPAPNTTTSNGQVPTDSQGDGPLHMGSVTSPDGGQKFSGPAASDGSPAQINFSPGTYLALQAMAGRNADEARVQAVGYITAMGQKGVIPLPVAEKLASAFGSPTYGIDVASRTAIAQTGMTVAGGIQMANIAQTGENSRKLLDIGELDRARGDVLVPTADPNNPGASPIMVPRRSITGPTPGYEPNVELQRGRPTVVNPPGGGQSVYMPAAKAMEPGAAQPTVPAQSSDQAQAQLIQQIMAETDPVKRQQLIERYQSTVGMAPKTPTTAEEANYQRQVNYGADQRLYAQPQTGIASFGVTAPVMFTTAAQKAINDRTYQLQSQSLRLRSDPAAAHEEAVQSLIADGTLQSPDEVNAARVPMRGRVTSAGFSGDTRIGNYVAPGQAKSSDHMIVRLRSETTPGSPATPAPASAPVAAAPTVPGPPQPTIPVPQAPAVSGPAPGPAFGPQRLPNPAIAPPAPPNPGVQTAPGRTMAGRSAPAPRMPPGALSPAPAGMVNGITGTMNKTGQRVVVRDGFLFPVQ